MADINYFFVQFVQSALGVVCGIGLVLIAFCSLMSFIAVWAYRAEKGTAEIETQAEAVEEDCLAHVGLFFGF